MEVKKRFQSDISESYADKLLCRKKPRATLGNKDNENDRDTTKTITFIPTAMLAKPKQLPPKPKEYAKPDHWIQPVKLKVDHEKLYKEERARIKKNAEVAGTYIRGLGLLSKSAKISTLNDIQDEDKFIEGIRRTGVRKNFSKEFLNEFFTTADAIASRQAKPKVAVLLSKRIPKFATGVKAGAQDIIL